MLRKRVLVILTILFGMALPIFWLGSVLADATVQTNQPLVVNEGGSGTITETLLFSDDPTAMGTTLTYTLVTTPANGTLVLTNTLTPGAQFTQLEIDNDLLVYTHDGSETSADSFDFTVATSTTMASGTFNITVLPDFDQEPVVDDQSFSVPENSGTSTDVGTIITSDLDFGDSLTYTIIAGNTGSPFAVGSNDGAITVDSPTPLDFETNLNLTFTVQVEDMGMLTDTAVITVNVTNENEAPTLSDNSFSLPENSANSTPVGTLTATDPDAGETFAYTITAQDPAPAFGIGSSSGQITVTDTNQLDFETTPTFTLTVEVADSGLLTDSAEIVINLSDANDDPVLSPAGPFDVPEDAGNGNSVGTPISATDQDLGTGDMLTYTISAGNSSGVFHIGASSGQISVADSGLLNYEGTPSYSLTVQVEDNAGATDSEVVVVNVTDVNEAPLTGSATYALNENSGNGISVGAVPVTDPEDDPLTYKITAGDPGAAFDVISGNIVVSDTTQLDFETTPAYTLTVAAEDAEFSRNATVNININDQNEPPSVEDDTFSIDENSSNGTAVGTVTFSDPDAADDGNLTFDILSGNTNGAFAINAGQITVANTNQLDYETTQSFMLSIIVTDTGGLSNTANVIINLNNLFDESPSVSNATFFVDQGADNGVLVGTVSATDPELSSGDALTYSIIGGNTGTVFAIDSSNGRITVPDTNKLDANAMPTFNLTVRVIDKGGQVDTATITVNVSPLPISYIYLPTVLNNYPPVEPNNNCTQAYSLGSGINYEFTANDQEDWYAISLTTTRNVSIVLSSFEPNEGQLVIYEGICGSGLTPLQNDGSDLATKTINITLNPGTYYVRVFSKPITNTTYNLQVNFN